MTMSIDTQTLLKSFLLTLMKLNNLQRGSVWINTDTGYLCVEAIDEENESIKGALISKNHPSIVGWVIENGKMTIGKPGADERHFKEIEKDFKVKSKIILCFPLVMESGEIYGAIQLIETETNKIFELSKDQYIDFLSDIVRVSSIALSKHMMIEEYIEEINRLKEMIQFENDESENNRLFEICSWADLDRKYAEFLLKEYDGDMEKAAFKAGMDINGFSDRLKSLGMV